MAKYIELEAKVLTKSEGQMGESQSGNISRGDEKIV